MSRRWATNIVVSIQLCENNKCSGGEQLRNWVPIKYQVFVDKCTATLKHFDEKGENSIKII